MSTVNTVSVRVQCKYCTQYTRKVGRGLNPFIGFTFKLFWIEASDGLSGMNIPNSLFRVADLFL